MDHRLRSGWVSSNGIHEKEKGGPGAALKRVLFAELRLSKGHDNRALFDDHVFGNDCFRFYDRIGVYHCGRVNLG